MCVTNITTRRTQPITLPSNHQQVRSSEEYSTSSSKNNNSTGASCSRLTARLVGTFELQTAPKPGELLKQEQGIVSSSSSSSSSNVSCFPQHRQKSSGFLTGATMASLDSANGNNEPRRRRKTQKPGKTAKMNDRHFVVHNYTDHAHEEPNDDEKPVMDCRTSFPYKLHAILEQVEQTGLSHVISWQPHGRCFVIHHPTEFIKTLLPAYFGQTKFTSFQRQLNLYGFSRLTRGPDAGGYYHELFLRGKGFLVKRMSRTKVKGTGYKAASSPDLEPCFYRMDFVASAGSTALATSSTWSCPIMKKSMVTPQGSPKSEPTLLSPAPSIQPLMDVGAAHRSFSTGVMISNFSSLRAPKDSNHMVLAMPRTTDCDTDSVLDEVVAELFDDEVMSGDGTCPELSDLGLGNAIPADNDLEVFLDLFVD